MFLIHLDSGLLNYIPTINIEYTSTYIGYKQYIEKHNKIDWYAQNIGTGSYSN